MSSNYLSQSRLEGSGSTLYAPALQPVAEKTQKKGSHSEDSIEYNSSEFELNTSFFDTVKSAERAPLPLPDNTISKTGLQALAQAFAAAFEAMNNGLITQTHDFTQLQELDQTQSNAVLQSTTDAINKENAAASESAKIAEYVQSTSSAESIFGWVMMGVTAALILGTLISGFFTGGATDAALPAEIEMVDMGGSEGASELDAEVPPEGDVPNEIDSGSELSNTNSEAENTENNITKDMKSTSANPTTAKKVLLKIAKPLLKIFVAAAMGSPLLMSAISNLKVAPELEQLSKDQATVGTAMATMKLNNTFFSFMQNLVKREASVSQEESSNASEVVETFSSVTNAWRGITYGLANAV